VEKRKETNELKVTAKMEKKHWSPTATPRRKSNELQILNKQHMNNGKI